ncbi:cell envelope integrity protein CreD [Candidatus Sumerlaeota bacterium]|nr:cell envelope integrity protein CreD [Candidatus Sumerlaeota bacterium]
MNMTPKSPGNMIGSFFEHHSNTFKLAGVICLVLVMLIPLRMIHSLLYERMQRRDQAVSEITTSWGGEQVIAGPVLVIPYQYRFKTWKEEIINGRQKQIEVEETGVANAYFLPAELNIEGEVEPSKLHRGIYEAVVYSGRLNLAGRFTEPDFAELGIEESDVQWDKAQVTLAVSDLRGTEELLKIQIGEQTYALTPGCKLNGYNSGVSARLPNLQERIKKLDFQLTLDFKGSKGLRFAPMGRQNRVKLTSPWPDPSFTGAFLPVQRDVSEQGFSASWETTWYGRNYPQQSADRKSGGVLNASTINPSLFGVDFIVLVDTYRMVERAIKYGVLFLALVFTAFFLFEVLAALRIHTIQYLLVGAALCLFYLAVLSLSEFIVFLYAYWAGALASMLLIVLYSLKVLKGGKRTAILAAALLTINSYLYIVLQLQDYSLLFGTAALFVVLGIVMYATRNLDLPEPEKE